ncbi:MAG: NADH:ubiquinone oxidoreductase [Chloroflexi bacterium RBG_16_56_8]|nr:MAG: NADH:ubiquinone oxidoreductase [Chloroflexi bacterium RBG_16_56_8]
MAELLYKDEVYAIIGAAMEVYNQLGTGFLEPVYQEAMEIETAYRKIPSKSQQEIIILYKGKPLKKHYIADLLCYEKIIVEIKAMDRLSSREESQLLNYLKATGMPVGLLINFGAENDLEWKRMVVTLAGVHKRQVSTRLSIINPKAISED